MLVSIRQVTKADARVCGRICFDAFAAIARQHGFPRDFQTEALSTGLLAQLIEHPRFFGVVAEVDGQVVGSNFLDERTTIGSVGPVSVAPWIQDRGIGNVLMRAVLDRAVIKRLSGIRLMQAAYHSRSLSLYTKLGFVTRDSYAVMQGVAPLRQGSAPAVPVVRPALPSDLSACNSLCRDVYGFDRLEEIRDAIGSNVARVVVRDGRISAYTTGIGLFGHSAAEDDEVLRVLILTSDQIGGTGFLLPTRNDRLLRQCLREGFRIVSLMNMMTIGEYRQLQGSFLPSVGF